MPKSLETHLLRRGYSAYPRLVVAHSRLADRLTDEFGVDPTQIYVVPLPVVRGSFGDSVAEPSSRRPLENRRVTTFLFFGTLRSNKGVHDYLHAIKSLPNDDMRFVFAGRGDPDLEDEIRTAAFRDPRIEADIGYITAECRAQLYSEADVVVLPYRELPAQSGVLHDAYAAGRPVVATDVGALGSSVRSDGTGWVVEVGNHRRLVEALSEAHADVATRIRYASRAEKAGDERTPERIAELLMDLYQLATQSLAGTGRRQ
jgi:glycosyltransferase involved in cell wall biosynthesis